MKDSFFLLPALLIASLLHAKKPIPTPTNDPYIGPLEPYLFKKILKGKDLDGSIAKHWSDPELRAIVEKHGIELFGGPMLGNVTPTSATFWLRATHPCEISVTVTEATPAKEPSPAFTAMAKATEARDLTALLEVRGLRPFTEYVARFSDENGPVGRPNNHFRTSPGKGQKARFSVGFGGGA
ncbi:MAG: hypothetical protein VB997_09475, partial [Opitutales bacterium]